MGKWTHFVPEPHKHDYPHSIEQFPNIRKPKVGDRWECECGDTFEVTSVRETGDQRDGFYWTLSYTLHTFANPVIRSKL